MLTKLLAASVLAAGLATSALAQSRADPADTEAGMAPGSGRSVVIDPAPVDPTLAEPDTVVTGSIIAGPDGTNSNADRNCPPSPQGAMPDATHKAPGTVSPTVNDRHCGM